MVQKSVSVFFIIRVDVNFLQLHLIELGLTFFLNLSRVYSLLCRGVCLGVYLGADAKGASGAEAPT